MKEGKENQESLSRVDRHAPLTICGCTVLRRRRGRLVIGQATRTECVGQSTYSRCLAQEGWMDPWSPGSSS